MRIGVSSLLVTVLMAGCATVRARPPAVDPKSRDTFVASRAETAGAPQSSNIQAVREASRVVDARLTGGRLAEQWSSDLAAAIALHSASATVESEVRLAQAYMDLRIADQAYEHFARAARLDPGESAAWEGRARIWRDWGLPQLGLGDAYRAVYAAPHSPAARNTLGTILQSLGKGREARAQFARALGLDSSAAYAHNNLCYSWLMEADTEAATDSCGKALAIEPGLVPARNNLALTRAIAGDLLGAAEIFSSSGGDGTAHYNLGIVYLAQHRYTAAAEAFDRAALLQPSLTAADARARQARQYAAKVPENGESREDR